MDGLLREVFVRCATIGGFEAGPSETGRPAGAAPGGSDFEGSVHDVWAWLVAALVGDHGVLADRVCSGARSLLRLRRPQLGTAVLLDIDASALPFTPDAAVEDVPAAWGETRFLVSDLVDWHLGERVRAFAPPTPSDSALYHGDSYPSMYDGFKTCFDFNVVLAQNGELVDKMLFEYKSAKSSDGDRMDGNAHERLGFQVLQYLEIANHLGNTSLNVIASSAYARYRNKYHVAFNQQAVRLGNTYATFVMRFASCPSEYAALFRIVTDFLLKGARPPRDFRAWVQTLTNAQ